MPESIKLSSLSNSPGSSTLVRLFSLLKPHKKLLLAAFLALALASCINLLFPEVIRRLLNDDYRYYLFEHPGTTTSLLIGLFLLQALCFYYRSLFFGIIGQKIVNDLRGNMFAAILNQEIKFFDQAKVGDLVSGLSADSTMIQEAISIKLSIFIRYAFQVLGGLILMLLISSLLTGMIILCVPLLIFSSKQFSKKLRHWSRLQQELLGLSSASASESFSNIRILKSLNQSRRAHERYLHSLAPIINAGINRTRVAAFFSSFMSFLINATLVLLLLYGLQQVADNSLSVGDLTAFVLYGVIVAISFAFVVNSYSEFVQALAASERIFNFLDFSSEEPVLESEVLTGEFKPQIEFCDITFCYPSREGSKILDKVSFTMEAGKVTALVGPSGSGKSTIANLIMKFYTPFAGKILISGKDIDDIPAFFLREKIALVSQTPEIFSVSIEENLRYAKPDATKEEVLEACRQAEIFEFINTLPAGLSTELGEAGVLLSSGQKQRIAIARAILRNPEILILDEATSALDSQSEHLVQKSLEHLMKNRTILIIAHRLSSVQRADKLIVLNHGRIIQTGTHSSLLAEAGLYRELVEKQEINAN